MRLCGTGPLKLLRQSVDVGSQGQRIREQPMFDRSQPGQDARVRRAGDGSYRHGLGEAHAVSESLLDGGEPRRIVPIEVIAARRIECDQHDAVRRLRAWRLRRVAGHSDAE